ncbi:Uncharacterized protein OBRU01_17665 [Operophtera brumata]|uniref:DUF4200 domain-containing protein n=1 Tax=Operophtera brumata TaxID=104452 RepID=A0A0L7L0T0_OPEBR|nr:Uncharacterized protein OBRU01_17665 [Operophtera brumata]
MTDWNQNLEYLFIFRTPKVTPKELSKRRITRSKLMKIPNNEGKISNKENVNPQLINIKNNTYKIHDRDITDGNFPNPFDISNHQRIFSQRKGQRKVKPEPFIMSEPHTICDVDDTFYKVIEGRPLRQFTDIKVYVRNIRDITLSKANAAYLNDQILQFEMKHTFEMEQYNKINKLFEKTKMNFVNFVKHSYQEAKAIQKTAEDKVLEVAKINEQLQVFSSRYVQLRNQLSSFLFSIDTLSMYGKFLNSLSPDWWRAEFDHLNLPQISTTSQSDVAVTSAASLDEYKPSIATIVPHLYFEEPKQLMGVYDNMSRQCLNYMKINLFAANIVNTVHKSRDVLNAQVKAEIDEMEEFIVMYESKIKFTEQKELEYKRVFEKLLFSEFQRLYASPENIKLFTCVQFVNTKVFGGPEDPKDSVRTLMHGLEMHYMELSSKMDSLDPKIVNLATRQMFAKDINTMQRAYLAQRTLKECDILSKALYTSFEPSRTLKKFKKAAKVSVQDEDKKK